MCRHSYPIHRHGEWYGDTFLSVSPCAYQALASPWQSVKVASQNRVLSPVGGSRWFAKTLDPSPGGGSRAGAT